METFFIEVVFPCSLLRTSKLRSHCRNRAVLLCFPALGPKSLGSRV